ncbi:helix-turn-helix domain-containing protein [uncultured Akkermansia sp.]|uniref:helix-turn-helix transcriptional regulator n=3 Tax=Bacteria TaxID=2 RepID=UPI00260D45C1|nr:helix-turn-helix domain-containing protein [uncultured Akkermansia sp.]
MPSIVAGGLAVQIIRRFISIDSSIQPMNLYTLLQATLSDPSSPNIVLNVTLADLHQLVVDTIDATRERLLPILMKAEEDRLLTKKEVYAQLGIGETSVWNFTKRGKLTPVKVNNSVRYRQSEVSDILNSKND